MSLIVLFQLYNSTVNLIKTKQSEIAMLRALGITKRQTKSIFSIASLTVSLVGIVSGSLISFILLTFSSGITTFLNKITGYSIPLLSINLELSFSYLNCFIVAIPLILITYIMSQIAVNKLLNKNNMEYLLNE